MWAKTTYTQAQTKKRKNKKKAKTVYKLITLSLMRKYEIRNEN